jgi:Fe-S oxidoreductase
MAMVSQEQFLQSHADFILERCTTCGKCVEVCPTRQYNASSKVDTETVASGILTILRREQPDAAARTFIEACCGTARCRDVCEEGINPQHMMRLAKVRLNQLDGKRPVPSDYHLVDLSRKLQLGPQEPRWYTRRPPEGARADVVFYMGCNIMRTPHIALQVMDILEALGEDYATVGGGANCCGIKQFRVGIPEAEKVSRNTMDNFAALQPHEVISWCPTCEVHFTDFGANYVEHEFPVNHISKFLLPRLEQLRPLLKPLEMKVVLEAHAPLHPGDSVTEDLATILRTIPGLDLLTTEQHAYGYSCTTTPQAEVRDANIEHLLDEAERVGADALISVYHGCHRSLVNAAAKRGTAFPILNWVTLLGRALGQEREDRYQLYSRLGDESAILEEALALDWGQGISVDNLRKAIKWEYGS